MAQEVRNDGSANHLVGPRARMACIGVAVWLMATHAHAQSNACDLLKNTLSARLPGGPGTFTLEAVPANTPLPPGGKFIGNCEGGAKKILYRRGASLEPVAGATTDAPPPPPRPVEAAPVPAPKPVTTPAPAPAPKPPAPVVKPAEVAAPAVAPPVREPDPKPFGGEPPSTPRVDEPAQPAPEPEPAVPGVSWSAWFDGLTAGRWSWIAVLLLPVALVAWRWWSHRRDYDAAGLPRGPRL
ncbi:DUF1161 domain-containing protein [Rhizobacter sp. Root1221]|uniref:DUF1161 domain-containing protein n=1 Tax=Rhizobacter sp. Root1221 TaxID=1736433 RepID=UPI000A4CF5A0|nr:DUF1161 domain-containing protein [Rhizobacter sp. Root1221]